MNMGNAKMSQFQCVQYCEKFLETMTLYQLLNIDNDVSISHVNLQAHVPSAISDK